jgi:hypothetical protein
MAASDARRAARDLIKRVAAEAFGAGSDDVIVVNELACTEPGCPPVETLIAVLGGAGQRKVTIHKPILEVDEADVRAAVARAAP